MTHHLTDKDREALHAYGQLGDISQAAVALGVKPATLKNRLAGVYEKLGVQSGVAAVYRLLTEDERHNPS